MHPKNIFRESFKSAKKLRNLIVFFALAHIVFLAFGQWMVYQEIPGVMYLRAEQLKQIQNLPYLKPLTGPLADSLALKVLYTFSFNLIFGAFFSTTLTGVVFFFPYLIAVWRSFIVGVLVYSLDVDFSMVAVFYGTFILEFGAYCLSSAVGTDIGLALLWPGRKGGRTRKEAFSTAIRDGAKLYVLIAIILFLAAVWEISWLHYMGPLIKPGALN